MSPRPIQRTQEKEANQLELVVEIDVSSRAFGSDLLPENESPRTTRGCACATAAPAPITSTAPANDRHRHNDLKRVRLVVTCGKK